VRKFLIFLLGISSISAAVVLTPKLAFANHQQDVLGVASTDCLSISPTAEGPGLVLPDSPLFFIDKIKQGFRLFLAFTPEQKAKIHNAIAGERLAELQLMLAKNNVAGIRTALQGVSDNSKAASEDLANAKLTGRNIDLLAKEINDSIKAKQATLTMLELKATGEIKAQVLASKEALKIAKVRAEESLPADLMASETIDDLNQQIADNITSANLSVAEINRAMGVLTKMASAGAVKNQSDLKNLISEFQKASVNLSKEVPTTTIAKPVKK
jgi:hypothetical protein